MSRNTPVREAENEESRAAPPEHEGSGASGERRELHACNALGAAPFRFDDSYWDEAFDSYHNPMLRVCCRF